MQYTEDQRLDIIQHKKEAELLFCASALIQPELVRHDAGWLQPDWFSNIDYKDYWTKILDGEDAIGSALSLGIYTKLADAQGKIISSFGFNNFAKTIADDYYLLTLGNNLVKVAKAVTARDLAKVSDLLSTLEKPPAHGEKNTAKSAVDVGMEFSSMLGNPNMAIQTYIPPLDEATGGFVRGGVHLVAARPSVGKSTFAFQIARNLAANKKKVVYFSVEMKAVNLWAKAACGISGVPWKKIKNGTLTDEEHDKLVSATGNLMSLYSDYLFIDDRSHLTSADIRKTVAEIEPDAIIVDHLGLLADKADSEIQRIGDITWAGKQIAKDFNLAAIYLQQLSRGVVNRDNKQPILTDLRDSGHAEENADTVVFLHRSDYYDDSSQQLRLWSFTKVIVAKDREGVRNIEAHVVYHMKDQWFYSLQAAREMGFLE